MRTRPLAIAAMAVLTVSPTVLRSEESPAAEPQENPTAKPEEKLDRRAESTTAEKKDPTVSEVTVVDGKPKVDGEAADAKAKEATAKFETPDWLTSVRLLNDLRMRLDTAFAPDSDFVTRWRIRPRLRLGGIATLKDDWAIGFRLASAPSVGKDSGGDPLSTNQTFEDNGSRKPVGVDWAFARWAPIHTRRWTGSIALGKLENPPNFTEDVFDVDYTPEGFAEQFSYKLQPNHTASAYLGQYVLDELQFSSKDPLLFVEQLRLDSKWDERLTTAFMISGLSITNPRSLTTASVPDSNHGNTRDDAGVLTNDYHLLIADASVTYSLDKAPLYKGRFPIKLYGEYIHNFGACGDNVGYAFGPSFGSVSQRISQTGKSQRGNWEISYRYQELQADSNYEELTASDNGAFYRSRPVGEPGASAFRPTFLNGLNLRGHALRLAYAPLDSLVLDIRVWRNGPIKVGSPGDKVQGVRMLTDLVWRF
jgi:putative porin